MAQAAPGRYPPEDIVISRSVMSVEDTPLEIVHVNVGSCNGCDAEIVAAVARCVPRSSRPRRPCARVLLVTGAATPAAARLLERLYQSLEDPKIVVAVGACAIHGGVFRHAGLRGVRGLVPVDIYAPGCPVRPETLTQALSMAAEMVKGWC